MAERKKRETEYVEPDSEELGFVLEPAKVEVGSGYTLSVSYDESEKPIVDVKTYGEVDIAKLRTDISRIFPNAKIRQLGQAQTVSIVKAQKKKRRKK